MSAPLEVLVDDAVYPEAPRWRDGALWYSDIGAGQICRVAAPGRKEVLAQGLDTPSGLGWTRAGELIFASILASAVYRLGADNRPQLLCGPERHGVEGTNDLATAGSRSYVTCAGRRHQAGDDLAALSQPVGKILMIDHESCEGRIVASGLRGPNGVAVTPDGSALIVAETFARRLLRFDIDPAGFLSNRQVFAELDVMVDGLALDAAGAAWVGAGRDFRLVDAQGRILDRVEAPGWTCVACMLGGPDGRSLFMAVSRFEGAEAIFAGRSEGRLLRTTVDVPAAPQPPA